MAKRVLWDFNEDNNTFSVSSKSTEADNEKLFTFKKPKYKSKETFEESLRIESFLDGAENGHIDTFII